MGFSSVNAAQKLYEKLKSTGWSNLLKAFLLSSDFTAILEKLSMEVDENQRFGPSLKEVFKAFELCDFDMVKVVIVGTEPSLEAGVADGLAFSGHKKNTVTEDFKNGILPKNTENLKDKKHVSMAHIATQGVLMLNLSLTATLGKKHKHLQLWEPFTAYLIDMLSRKKPDLVWVFHGKVPKMSSVLVNSGNVITVCDSQEWLTNNICDKVNSKLIELVKKPILW